MFRLLSIFIGLSLLTPSAFSEVVLYNNIVNPDHKCVGEQKLERDQFARKTLTLFLTVDVNDLVKYQTNQARKKIEVAYQDRRCTDYLEEAYQKLVQAMHENQAILQANSQHSVPLWDIVDHVIEVERNLYPIRRKQPLDDEFSGAKTTFEHKGNMITFKEMIKEIFQEYPTMRDYWLSQLDKAKP